jgi:membrane protein
MAQQSRIARGWQTFTYYVRGIAKRFVDEDVFLWCGGVAFKVLVTFLPLCLLAFGIFGLFLRRERILFGLTQFLESFLPGDQTAEVILVLRAYAGASNTITVIGSVALLVTGVSLFTTLRTVLENVFHKTHVRRSTVHGYLSDLRMAVLCGGLFVLSMGLSVLLINISRFGVDVISWIDIQALSLEQAWRTAVTWLGYVVPLAVTSTLFFLLFYLTPRPHPSTGSCLIGALFAGVGWELAKHAFAFVARHTSTFERLRNVDELIGLNALGEAFVLAVVLVFWMYYSSVLLIVGGMITALRDERLGRTEPLSAATG